MKKIWIVLAIILIIVTGLGFSLLNNSEDSNDLLSKIDNNAPCYSAIEKADKAMKDPCNDEDLMEALSLINEETSGEQYEICLETLRSYFAEVDKICEKTTTERFSDIAKKASEEVRGNTDCFDKQAMGLPCD